MRKKKQINFTVLYGVVTKKTQKSIWINYGAGKIKVLLDELLEDESQELLEELGRIQENFTISVSGYIKQGWIRTHLIAQQISIFDKKPHFIDLG